MASLKPQTLLAMHLSLVGSEDKSPADINISHHAGNGKAFVIPGRVAVEVGCTCGSNIGGVWHGPRKNNPAAAPFRYRGVRGTRSSRPAWAGAVDLRAVDLRAAGSAGSVTIFLPAYGSA